MSLQQTRGRVKLTPAPAARPQVVARWHRSRQHAKRPPQLHRSARPRAAPSFHASPPCRQPQQPTCPQETRPSRPAHSLPARPRTPCRCSRRPRTPPASQAGAQEGGQHASQGMRLLDTRKARLVAGVRSGESARGKQRSGRSGGRSGWHTLPPAALQAWIAASSASASCTLRSTCTPCRSAPGVLKSASVTGCRRGGRRGQTASLRPQRAALQQLASQQAPRCEHCRHRHCCCCCCCCFA